MRKDKPAMLSIRARVPSAAAWLRSGWEIQAVAGDIKKVRVCSALATAGSLGVGLLQHSAPSLRLEGRGLATRGGKWRRSEEQLALKAQEALEMAGEAEEVEDGRRHVHLVVEIKQARSCAEVRDASLQREKRDIHILVRRTESLLKV